MIEPTVGRVVHYHPYKGANALSRDEILNFGRGPLAAIVVHVWNDRCVNLCVFDSTGRPHGCCYVPLLQEDDPAPADGRYCEWLPYQKGQAAKNEQLQDELKLARRGIDAHQEGANHE